jgi:ACS family D-galactonate transporter-like MFS transporter
MPPTPEHPVPARRWGVAILLSVGVLVIFFDRINLSVAAPQLQEELHLNHAQMGYLLSAYSWTYTALQIPMGLLVDRMGAMGIGRLGSLLWTVASGLTAIASGFWWIFGARLFLGVAEAPSFPTVSKATGHWFPRKERARATAIFDCSGKFSSVIGIPIIAVAVVHLGWRSGFILTTAISLAYFVVFTVLYRDPSRDKGLSPEELNYIRQGGAMPEGQSESNPVGMLGYLLRQPKVWGLTIGFGAYGYSFYMFLTWLPSYLVTMMGMSILKSATFAAIPWAVASVFDIGVGGWLIDFLLARGADETRVRKTVFVVGMLFGLAVTGAAFTTSPVWATVWISIALSGLAAAAPVAWSLPSLIAPKGGIGAVGGIMNFACNAMGIAAPIASGYILEYTHSFAWAFLVAAAVLVVGILGIVLLLGDIETMPDPPSSRPASSA